MLEERCVGYVGDVETRAVCGGGLGGGGGVSSQVVEVSPQGDCGERWTTGWGWAGPRVVIPRLGVTVVG